MKDILTEVKAASIREARAFRKYEQEREKYCDLVWQAQAQGINVTQIAAAAKTTRQSIYHLLKQEEKRRNEETKYRKIREWLREEKGMDVPVNGAIAASLIQDYDNWLTTQS